MLMILARASKCVGRTEIIEFGRESAIQQYQRAETKLGGSVNTICQKVDTINTHIDNVLKNAPTKLNVAVHASDEDMNAIQNLFNNEHKWILGKMQAHYREINSMFADELRVAQKRYKEYDGCYLGHYIQYFFWFFFTLGFFVFVAVVVSWIGGYNGWFK